MTENTALEKPDLSKIPASMLVDHIGQLDARIAPLKEQREEYAEELKRRGVNKYVGTLYECVVFKQERETLVADLVRKYMAPTKLPKCVKVIEALVLKVTGRKMA